MTQAQQRSSPFAFATTHPYQGLQKHLPAHLLAIADDPASTSWERCLADFLRSIYSLSTSAQSLYIYATTLHRFFLASARQGPPKHPDLYTREDIEDFIHRSSASPRSRGVPPSVSAMNQRLMVLSSFYRYASIYYLETQDGSLQALFVRPLPTAGMAYGRSPRVYRAFSFEEMERFFAAIPTDSMIGLRDRAIFLMYFWTARRRSEIARLRWGDIEQGIIIDEHGQRRVGWLYHFTGKGKAGEDDISELPVPAKAALDRYLEATGRLATIRPGDPLFLAIGHGRSAGSAVSAGSASGRVPRPLTGSMMDYALKRYARAAGLDARRLSLHSFRHTAAQQRYAAGEDIRSLQRLLRHESLATTDIYLRGLMGTADPGAKLLEDRFSKFSLH